MLLLGVNLFVVLIRKDFLLYKAIQRVNVNSAHQFFLTKNTNECVTSLVQSLSDNLTVNSLLNISASINVARILLTELEFRIKFLIF